MANAPGDGSIATLRNGRQWVRSPVQPNGKRKSLGTYATRAEAEEILLAFLCLQGTPGAVPASVVTFERFGREVLDLREEEGIRGIAQERSRFEFHLATSLLADMPLEKIGPPQIAELVRALMRKDATDKRGRRKISRKTVQRCLAIVSSVFAEAVTRGHVAANPTVGVKAKRRADESSDEPWAYLNPDEQRALATCEAIPYADRLIIRFAIGTGVRQGELCHNLLADLHVDGDEPFLFVRYGSKGKPPKSGKTRRVPLFGDALEAAREWLALLPSYARANPDKLIFPTATGCRRQAAKTLGNGRMEAGVWVGRFEKYVRAAGIEKHVRWHDLRHTCASSLVAGWWGRKWSLDEIKELLGHSSIVVTQKYAHLGETSLKAAARETVGSSGLGPETNRLKAGCSTIELRAPVGGYDLVMAEKTGPFYRGFEGLTHALKGQEPFQGLREVANAGPPSTGGLVTTLAETLLDLVRRGQAEAALAVAVSLASAAIASDAVVEVSPRRIRA